MAKTDSGTQRSNPSELVARNQVTEIKESVDNADKNNEVFHIYI